MTPPDDYNSATFQMQIEIRDRLMAIETRLAEHVINRDREISNLNRYAEENRAKSVAAYSASLENAADIAELKEAMRWRDRFTVTQLAAIIVAVILLFIQG